MCPQFAQRGLTSDFSPACQFSAGNSSPLIAPRTVPLAHSAVARDPAGFSCANNNSCVQSFFWRIWPSDSCLHRLPKLPVPLPRGGVGNIILTCTARESCVGAVVMAGSGPVTILTLPDALVAPYISGGSGPINVTCVTGTCDYGNAFLVQGAGPIFAPGFSSYRCTNNQWQCANGACVTDLATCGMCSALVP